ncbi:FecR family protein [Leptobacterium sp. I13]|uniref:FecR family protein n=1 Tax=Leptobacterium meishanense TaxID=3128904 RepID=UPI0030EE7583
MKTENYLAKWLSGQLSEKELTAFEKSPEYASYAKIISHTDKLHAPDYDLEEVYELVKQRTTEVSQPKVIRLNPFKKWLQIAAVFAVLLGAYYFLILRDITVTTGYAEHTTFLLPDNSEVTLNAKSKAYYNKNSWDDKRSITLEGEAFFKVTKGSTFDVLTDKGKVTVVGTQFTVTDRDSFFEVVCFEGTVKVFYGEKKTMLTQGESFKIYNGASVRKKSIVLKSPSWIHNESIFKSVPFRYVLDEMERQYNITINTQGVDQKSFFTGGFTHDNLEMALKSVCMPLQLKYIIKDPKNVVLYAE